MLPIEVLALNFWGLNLCRGVWIYLKITLLSAFS